MQVAYKTTPSGRLHLHIFFPPGGIPVNATPAIMLFFGGGWKTGSPRQFYPQASHLAERGIVAIAADYRTAQLHGTNPLDAVEDSVDAMRWLRSHASMFGIDPKRIAAGGASAGGLLAATLTYFSGPFLNGFRADALVLFNPVLDARPWRASIGPEWQRLSPRAHLSASWPPTLILNGTADKTTPIAIARTTVAALASAGVDARLIEHADRGHGFFNASRPADFAQTMAATVEFLGQRGFLPLSHP